MAFFDNLGRKMSEAGQKVIQKTGEMSDTSRLNAQISDEEKKINAAYLQIGKLYASVHRNDPEPDFAALVESVGQSEQTIRACREQIQKIRGVRSCPNCGAEVSVGSAFCATCGSPMPAEKPSVSGDVLVCASCGTVLEAGMRFCTNCGRPVSKPAAAPVAPPAPAAASIVPPEPDEPAAPAAEPEIPHEAPAEEIPAGFSTPDFLDEPPVMNASAVESPAVEEAPASEPDLEQPMTEADAHVEQAQSVCPICGAPVEPGDAFCMGCGTKL